MMARTATARNRWKSRLGAAWRALLAAAAPAQASPAHIRSEVVPLIKKHAADLPIDFLAGWVAVESDGDIKSTTSLGERGYFQIHPEEASGPLKIAAFERVSRDPDY